MNILNDLKIVYKKAFSETVTRIKKNPVSLLLPLIYSILLGVSYSILSSVMNRFISSMLVGFLIPIVSSLILSSYFELLSDLNFYNRLGFKYFLNSFKKNASSIYSVYFLFMLISWIVPMVGNYSMVLIINIILFFLLNSISEAIYIRGEYYTSAFSYTFSFMKENFIHWTLPLLLYFGITGLILKPVGVISLMSNDVIAFTTGYPVSLYDFQSIQSLVPIVITQIITAVYVIFRGALYQILSTSTMRKRQYMGEI